MKKINFLIICVFIVTIVYGQKNVYDSYEPFVIEFQNVAFVTSDSTYKFTRYITLNGIFNFRENFANPDDIVRYPYWIFGKPNEYNLEPGNYLVSFKPISDDIDTIYSYFPAKQTENQNLLENIQTELKYSYILRQVGETDISLENNIIRLLVPYEVLDNYCTLYNIFTVRFFEDYVKLYKQTLRSVDYNGIQLVRTDSCLLNKREINNIMKRLTNIKPISDITCIVSNNPWLLEYNDSEYKRFINTMFLNSPNDLNKCLYAPKDLSIVASLCSLISSMGRKHF